MCAQPAPVKVGSLCMCTPPHPFSQGGCSRMWTVPLPGGMVFTHVHTLLVEVGPLRMRLTPLSQGGCSRVHREPLRGGRVFTHAYNPPSAREAVHACAPLLSVQKGVCSRTRRAPPPPWRTFANAPRSAWLRGWLRLAPRPPLGCERVTLAQRHTSGWE